MMGSKQLWVTCIYFAVCTVLVEIPLAVPIRPQVDIAPDVFTILAGAQRMYEGLIPYVDYDTLLGPFPNFPIVAAMWLVGQNLYALAVASSITVPIIGSLVWFLFLREKMTILNLCISVYICLTWAAPYPLHIPLVGLSYAMFYNREGFALLSLLTVMCMDRRANHPWMFGVLCGILMFTKVPFGIASLMLAYLMWQQGGFKNRLPFFFLGLANVVAIVVAYLGFDGCFDMVAGVVRASGLLPPEEKFHRLRIAFYDLVEMVPAIPLVILLYRLKLCRPLQLANECLWIGAAAVLSEYSCTPLIGIANLEIPPLVIYDLFLVGRLIEQRGWNVPMWGKYAYCFCFLGFTAMSGKAVLGELFWVSVERPLESAPLIGQVHAPGFDEMSLVGSYGYRWNHGPPLFAIINDGLRLLNKHPSLQHEKVACLDFTDWFSVARQAPSADHMPIVVHFKYTMDEDHYPPAEFALKGCSGVMIPKEPNRPVEGSYVLEDAYTVYIHTHFPKRDESPLWILFYK